MINLLITLPPFFVQNYCKFSAFSLKFQNFSQSLKYQFWKKSLRKNTTLSSWTLFQHICSHFWAWLLLYSAITPKSEDKYVLILFNSTELHFSEVYFFQNWYFRTISSHSRSEQFWSQNTISLRSLLKWRNIS